MNSELARVRPALKATLKSLMYPQVIMMMFLPLIFSVLLVIFALWFSWNFWTSYAQSGSLAMQPYWMWLVAHTPDFLQPIVSGLNVAVPWLMAGLLIVVAIPVIMALNLFFVSLVTSTYLVKWIARKDYPTLEFKGRSRLFRSLGNSLISMVLYVVASLVVALPLFWLPGLAVIVSLVLTGWLNQRICSFDALTDVATDDEFRHVREQNGQRGFVLGCLAAALMFLPLGFFIAPVLTMVAYVHFNFQGLILLRSQQKAPLQT